MMIIVCDKIDLLGFVFWSVTFWVAGYLYGLDKERRNRNGKRCKQAPGMGEEDSGCSSGSGEIS